MLAVNQLNGFGGVGADPGTWQTVFNATLTTNDTSGTGLTLRIPFQLDSLTVPTGTPTKIRITIAASTAAGCVFDTWYVGNRAASGDDWDFAAAPTQITWDAGSASKTITASNSYLSDEINFSWDTSKGLVFSTYISTGSGGGRRVDPTGSVSTYYKAGATDVTTVDASGYTSHSTTTWWITKIEVFA